MSRERYSQEEQQFYRAYLQSQAWRERKTARLKKAGYRCEWSYHHFDGRPDERCPRTRYLCTHHNTYERLGAEQDGDLDIYCWSHHLLEHLLWQRCSMCGSVPCLENDEAAEQWLKIALLTLEIDLDTGPVDWKKLPNKEVLLAMVPSRCPTCLGLFGPEPEE